MVTTTAYFAAIRCTENREWIDPGSIDGLHEETKRKAAEMDKQIPHWANNNPVVRISRIEISEMQI